jgi:hypothetical protein
MPKRWTPSLALILALIGLAPLLNLALRGNPFRFTVLLINIFALAVLAAMRLPRYAPAFISVSAGALSLVVIEGFFVLIEPVPTHLEGSVNNNYITHDTPFGYAPNPGVFSSMKCQGDCAAGRLYDVTYTIENGGYRHTPQEHGTAKSNKVLFFGDSATFGEGLNDDETLPYYFARLRPDAEVFNFAFHGYGAHQVLRALETGRFDAYTGPKPNLIVFPTTPWHAERSYCLHYFTQRTPRYEVVGDEAVHVGQCPEEGIVGRFLHQWKTYEYFTQHIPRDIFWADEKYKRYLAIIKRAQRLAKEKYGARFVIGFIRVSDVFFRGSSYSNERILDYFRENGIETIDLTLSDNPGAIDPSLTIPVDGHPSARAQFLRAEILARLLDERGCDNGASHRCDSVQNATKYQSHN